jgi:hypothetical protein
MADLTVTAASVVNVTAQIAYGLAGETITAGQAIYIKSSDGKLWKAQCDGTAEEGAPTGVSLNGGAVGQTIAYATNGAIVIGATTVKTTTYVLSAAAGGICPQADLVSTNRIVRVGHATDAVGAFIVDIKAVGAVV